MVPYIKQALLHFSVEEAAFGVGWANLVGFIASAHFMTSLNGTDLMQQFLPPRLLVPGDVPGQIKNMSKLVNRALIMIEDLSVLNSDSGGEILKAWDRAMCSKQGRKEGRYLINNGIQDPAVLVPGVLKLIAELPLPCD